MEEDGYDVRAVEARLAHMEAARRARSTVAMRQAIQPPQRPVVVGDFELSAMDSSGSDSEDAGDDDNGTARVAKPRLRDSLDLSMSVSMAMPAAPMECRKAPLTRPKQHDTREKEPVAVEARTSSEPRVFAPTSLAESGRKAELCDNDLFTGKLVQRRRELEKQAAQQQRDLVTVHSQPDETKQLPPTLMLPATTKGELKPPAPMRHNLQTVETHEPTLRSRKDDSDTHGASGAEIPLEMASRRANVRGAEVVVDIPQKKPISAVDNKRGLVPPTAAATVTAPPVLRQQSTKQIPRQQSTACQDLPPKASLVNPPTSNKPADATADATASTAVASALAGISKPLRYTRPPAATNQAPVVVVAAPLVKKASSPIKREPEDPTTDDVIDDLLTAEEARLRESLDKLSQRLTSIATVRGTTAPQIVPPSNQANVPDSTETDETRTLRSASYGGGTHSRLHQQTSPTARASHARRSELSGGVHKARVRIGGMTAQEASRADTKTDGGKHKIVVKRDLAHLLF